MLILIPYYNFTGYDRLLDNHIRAVQLMTAAGAECVTLQLTLEGAAVDRIPESSKHTVIRFSTRSILWHKEALINAGAAWAKEHGQLVDDKLLWIDSGCYLGPDTAYQTVADDLDKYDVVHALQRVNYYDANGVLGKHVRGAVNTIRNPPFIRKAPGGAWAAHLKFFEQGGLYPHCVTGGGDTAMLSAVCGIHWTMPMSSHAKPQFDKYVQRTQAFKYTFGYSAGVMFEHLWHMPAAKAKYAARHNILRKHSFSPGRDIEVQPNGLIEWSGEARRRKQEMVDKVADYIRSRCP
jgi:hypothetical protein